MPTTPTRRSSGISADRITGSPMARSTIRARITGAIVLTAVLMEPAAAQLGPDRAARLVDQVEVTPHDEQTDIIVQFNCPLRYLSHLPATEGSEIHIQLLPMGECGMGPLAQVAPEIAPLSDETGTVQSVRVESEAPGQITLLLGFRAPQQYVIAQGADPRGLRIRLLKQNRGRSRILISQSPDSTETFAVNLDSQPKPFDPAAIALAQERLKIPVFVSETVVNDTKWYRLRAGPLEQQADAERVLSSALQEYPRAWLARGDDTATSEVNSPAAPANPPPQVGRIGTDPPMEAAALRKMISDARAAVAAHDYPRAITLLTQLQRQPEFPDRARVQELLGLAREKAGQLAHAKAEYEEYLRRYPQGEGAERVRARLRVLRAASSAPRSPAGAATQAAPAWHLDGGWGQLFRYDSSRFASGGTTTAATDLSNSQQTTRQNALYNDLDLLLRHRGEDLDMLMRLSAGYAKEFSANAFGDNKRVSLASIELNDRALGLLARFGRQVQYQYGILGTFDGLLLSYQLHPGWSLNAAAGYPVSQTGESIDTQQRFETFAVAYAPAGRRWDGSIFATQEQLDGVRDRRATGFEARYLASRASLVGFVDYDVSFKSLNVATLLGTLQLPARWLVSLDVERRNSPILTTQNALIGQSETDLAQLERKYTL